MATRTRKRRSCKLKRSVRNKKGIKRKCKKRRKRRKSYKMRIQSLASIVKTASANNIRGNNLNEKLLNVDNLDIDIISKRDIENELIINGASSILRDFKNMNDYDRKYTLLSDLILNGKFTDLQIIFQYFPNYVNSVGSINPNRIVPSTPLIEASKFGYNDIFNLIMMTTNNENKRFVDTRGNNALHHAVKFGNFYAVDLLLLDNIIDINSKDNQGRTPLMLASIHDDKNILKLLLENGANKFVKDNFGKDVFDYNSKLMEDVDFDMRVDRIGLDRIDFGI